MAKTYITDPKQDEEVFKALLRTPAGKKLAADRAREFHDYMMDYSTIYPLLHSKANTHG